MPLPVFDRLDATARAVDRASETRRTPRASTARVAASGRTSTRHPQPSRRQRGFSFIEILFAVAVMGLGFIMIAAVFPVGLQQTKLNMDETSSAASSRGAVYQLNQLTQATVQYLNLNLATPVPARDFTTLLPVTYDGTTFPTPAVGASITLTGTVRSIRDPRPFTGYAAADSLSLRDAMWNKVSGSLISPSDARNGSTLLYRRDMVVSNVAGTVVHKPAANAQLIVINGQATAQSSYVTADVQTLPAGTPPAIYNLEPKPVGVIITPVDTENIWTIKFVSANGIDGYGTTAPTNAAAYSQAVDAVVQGAVGEGMYVVIADDKITNTAAPFKDIGRLNGHTFRVGVRRDDLDPADKSTFQLAPGFEPPLDPGDSGQLNDAAKDDIVGAGSAAASTPGTAGSFNGVAYNGTNIHYNGPALAFVLGRGFLSALANGTPAATPTSASGYTGPVQDVSLYTTFVTLPVGTQ